MFKKVISIFLATVIVISMVMIPVSAQTVNSETTSMTSDITVEGTNSFGEILSAEFASEVSGSEFENYRITELTVEEQIATVRYEAISDCTVLVALYNENTNQLLASGKATADDLADEIEVNIETENMPQYFVAKAYMLNDKYTPLSEVFTTTLYTEAIQKVKNSTIDDYDPEKVIKLDESNDNNFAVFNDEVIIFENVENQNVYDGYDRYTGQYMFSNPTDELKNLSEGNIILIEGIIIKVRFVDFYDGRVYIGKEDTEVEEVFDYVKIQALQETDECEINDSNLDSDVVFKGISDSSKRRELAIEGETTFEKKLEYDLTGEDDEDAPISIEGTVSLGLKFALEYYVSFSEQYLDIGVEYGVDYTVALKVQTGQRVIKELAEVTYSPCAGVNIVFTPSVVFQAEATVSLSISYKGKVGVKAVAGEELENTSETPDPDMEMKFEGEVFIGIAFEPSLKIEALSCTLASAEIEVLVGVKVSVEPAEDDELHKCGICYSGSLSAEVGLVATVKIKKEEMGELSASVGIHIGDFYYSVSLEEWGWGECDNMRDPSEITEPTETTVSSTDSGITEDTFPTNPTNKNTNSTDPSDTTTTLPTSTDSTESTSFDPSVVESGMCGAGISWELSTEDNIEYTLTLVGSGRMYAYEDSAALPWSGNNKITKIILDPNITYLCNQAFWDLPIKEIKLPDGLVELGVYCFSNCNELVEVILPDNMTEIAESAFSYCTKLERVVFPDKLIKIGESAFLGCRRLTNLELPEKLTIIDKNAFSSCTNLETVNLPESLESIEYGAFGGCYKLNSLKLPESNPLEIGRAAFSGCSALTTLTIPENVYYVGGSAFQLCENLETVYIYGYASFDDDVFLGATNLKTVFVYGDPAFSEETFPEGTNISYLSMRNNVYSLSGSNLLPSGNIVLKKTFTDLFSNTDYILIVVKSDKTKDLLSGDNLLYIDQQTADDNGNITLDYIPREEAENSVCLAFGPETYRMGDVNMDGKININDATAIQRHLVGMITLSADSLELADTDNSGILDISDVTTIQYYLVSKWKENSVVGAATKILVL